MKRHYLLTCGAAAWLLAAGALSVSAQSGRQNTPSSAMAAPVTTGPHGGSLRQSDGVQLETVVSTGGLQLFVYDRAGHSIAVDRARGAVSLHVDGNAKRYRYDLLPDGKGGLAVPVDLSAIAGRQIDLAFHVVGIPSVGAEGLRFREVTTVPADPQQMAAAAIARQKVCPVSGKPLGSMGAPVAVDVAGQPLYVCCAGCVDAVKADPAKYAAGRPEVTVVKATPADAALIAKQATCPVMDEPLGSMGGPVKLMVGDKPIFLCCKGCIKKVQAEPAKYLAKVHGKAAGPSDAGGAVAAAGDQIRPGVFKVAAADAPYVATQKRCPVMDEPLDAMGGPYRVNADGKAVYICCPGCAKKIAADPQKYLAVLAQQGVDAPVLR